MPALESKSGVPTPGLTVASILPVELLSVEHAASCAGRGLPRRLRLLLVTGFAWSTCVRTARSRHDAPKILELIAL
jgi:hypothetical protein